MTALTTVGRPCLDTYQSPVGRSGPSVGRKSCNYACHYESDSTPPANGHGSPAVFRTHCRHSALATCQRRQWVAEYGGNLARRGSPHAATQRDVVVFGQSAVIKLPRIATLPPNPNPSGPIGSGCAVECRQPQHYYTIDRGGLDTARGSCSSPPSNRSRSNCSCHGLGLDGGQGRLSSVKGYRCVRSFHYRRASIGRDDKTL